MEPPPSHATLSSDEKHPAYPADSGSNTDIAEPVSQKMSNLRRATCLAIFCLALFSDALMTSSMIICLDTIGADFNESTNIVPWIMTAYSLTFGSFLLLAGTISDIYHPKPIFIAGFLFIGILGIGGGFIKNNIIPLIVLRAFQGIGAAMTIPSATSMLTAAYTTPFFAGAGTLGLCAGFVLGGIVVQFATWRWAFWIVPMITIPVSAASILLIPGSRTATGSKSHDKRMDIVGVFILTVLTPLIISVLSFVVFFFYQTRLNENHALIPPKMWFIPNFLVLVFVSLCTQIYLTGPVLVFSVFWPAAYQWSPLTIGLHGLPMGVTAVIVCVLLPRYILQLPPRISLVIATSMSGLFSILMVFADSRDRYWSFVFPSMVLITLGSSAAYMISNVGIITSVPSHSVGVAAAIFSAAQQVGGAINVAIITTIFVQVRNDHPFPSYKSTASAMWFIVALGVAQATVVAIFFKPQPNAVEGSEAPGNESEEQRKL
ncbi:major facilitator superfamily domain-containing protein [Flammula alnicola]|nr:major facilitator superfamily domain-containing protein [Flammula alnicola]